MMVGMWLQEKRSSLQIQEVAKMLKVNRRTLSNWKKSAKIDEIKIGRPRYSKRERFLSLLKVGREWKSQGCVGWRPVKSGLGNKVPTRLVQQYIARLKFLKRKKNQIKLKQNRTSVRVLHKNTYWSQDGAKYKGKKYQIIKDKCKQRK